MLDRPFGRRSLLRGAGALTAASLAPWTAGCAPDDDNALTFFFASNPDERDVRMRIVDEFQRRHPDIKVRPVLSGAGRDAAAGDVLRGRQVSGCDDGVGVDLRRTRRPGGVAGPQHPAGSRPSLRSGTAVQTASGRCMTPSRSRAVSTHYRSNGPETTCSTTSGCSPRPACRHRPERGSSRGAWASSWTPPRLSPNRTDRGGPPNGVSSTCGFPTIRPGCSP